MDDETPHDMIQRLWRDMDKGHKLPDWVLEPTEEEHAGEPTDA
jgi:hypothetical protein